MSAVLEAGGKGSSQHPAIGNNGGRHALFLCVFTLAIVPLTFLSLATAVSCRDRLTTFLVLARPGSPLPSSSASLAASLAPATAAAAATVDSNDAKIDPTAKNITTTTTTTPSASSSSPPISHNRCTFNDYLHGGQWQATDEAQVRPGYDSCTIDPRQDCRAHASAGGAAASYLHQKWVPKDPRCALRQLTPEQVKCCLAGQRILFLGDSLARNHQESLQCMLREESEEATNSSSSPLAIKTSTYSVIPPEAIAQVANEDGDDATTTPTILVVSTGPHWNPYAFGFNVSYATEWSEIPGGEAAGKEIVRSAIRERIQALNKLPQSVHTIIWRTPDLSHSSAPNSKEPWLHGCVAFPPSWDPWGSQLPPSGGNKLQWIYDAVNEYASAAKDSRVQVMDVMGMVGQRADGRPSAHLNRTRDGVAVHDCLHWCLPGVPDATNEVLINYLCQDFERGD